LSFAGNKIVKTEGYLKGEVVIFYRLFYKEGNKDNVVIIHGLGEHSGRYSEFLEYLTINGFNVLTYDLRGHGRSGGERGHIDKFEKYLNDTKFLLDSNGLKRVHIIGHSMGGLIAIRFAEEMSNYVKTLCVSGPLLGLNVDVSFIKRFAAKLLSCIYPSFTMDNGLDPNLLTHDKIIVDRYVNDPNVHRRVSARWFTEVLLNMDIAREKSDAIKIPILLLHGSDDRLTSPSATDDFYKKLNFNKKRIIIYNGLYHEILNEFDKEKVYGDILTFLKTSEEINEI